MSNPECFSCDRRQICEPVLGEIAVELITNASRMDEKVHTDFNPMDTLFMFKVISNTVSTGDTTELEQFAAKIDLSDIPPANFELIAKGYSKLREAGCSLDKRAFGVKLLSYISGNMLTIMTRVMEEEMVRQLNDQVDEDARLRGILGDTKLELRGILSEIDAFTSSEREIGETLRNSGSELGEILGNINEILDRSDTSIVREPRKSLEVLKSEEEARYIAANGWDAENLDFSRKLEIRTHLREIGLIR